MDQGSGARRRETPRLPVQSRCWTTWTGWAFVDAGRLTHNPEVAGSNPAPATRQNGSPDLIWGAVFVGPVTNFVTNGCVTMSHKREGLLAQIEAGVFDDTVPLSSLLQKCIVLGGQVGSEKMRDWARRELNGYAGAETVPDYRHIPAAVMVVITNRVGYNRITQRIDDSAFPDQIRDIIREKVDLEDAILGAGIGELEALASQDTDEHRLIPSWASFIADTLNQFNMAPNSRVAEVYWSVSNASIRVFSSVSAPPWPNWPPS